MVAQGVDAADVEQLGKGSDAAVLLFLPQNPRHAQDRLIRPRHDIAQMRQRVQPEFVLGGDMARVVIGHVMRRAVPKRQSQMDRR
jgi:hypothetical protein